MVVCLSEHKLPSREECFKILREFDVPDNVMRHTELVNKIAVFLANKLQEAGVDIDVDLVDRASLLHDLDKMQTIKDDAHGEKTEEILIQKGYPVVGKIAKQHRFKWIHDPKLSWEAKVVNYSDKRVMHDQLVSLTERLKDAWERYKDIAEYRDKKAEELFFALEKEIFSLIRLIPEDLEKYI